MGKLDGKVALIPGFGRNIGRATTPKLAGEGAHIVVNARANQAEADQTSSVWPFSASADPNSKDNGHVTLLNGRPSTWNCAGGRHRVRYCGETGKA